MRASPLAVFCLRYTTLKEVAQAVQKDVELTHSNKLAQLATITYVIGLREAILTGDPEKVLATVEGYIKNEVEDE